MKILPLSIRVFNIINLLNSLVELKVSKKLKKEMKKRRNWQKLMGVLYFILMKVLITMI
jgi:hypothetical protein